MEERSNVFLGLPQGQPPDGDVRASSSVGDAGGPSDYDLLTAGVCGATFGAETLLKGPEMEQKAELDFDIPDDALLTEALQDVLPSLPMSPGKLGPSEQPRGLPHPPEGLNCAGMYYESLENVEGYYLASEVSEEVRGVSGGASSAKTGSQSFDYIRPAAVLETHGIAVPSHLGSMISECDGTYPFKPSATLPIDSKLTAVPDEATSIITYPSQPCATLPIDSKITAVPDEATSFITYPSQPCATLLIDSKLIAVPDEATNIITYPSQPCGTLPINSKLTAVPDEATSIITYPSQPCGTQLTDSKLTAVPDKATRIIIYPSQPCGTQLIDSKLTTVPDKATTTVDTHTEASSTPKKRRRRRRQPEGEDGEARKARLYEQGPLSDAKEERKRKDAIRAKTCRERNRMEVKELRERLEEVERERDRLAWELAGRCSYEEVLLCVLEEKHGIVVMPYSAPREQMTPLQSQTSG